MNEKENCRRSISSFLKEEDSNLSCRIGKLLRGATIGTALLIMPPSVNNYLDIPKPLDIVKTDFIEAYKISNAIRAASSYEEGKDKWYTSASYMHDVMNEAAWASRELKIPREFIFSQWVMESGLNQKPSMTAIANNNLGGLSKNGLMRFDTLHDFAKAYVETLRNDGATDTTDFWKIVNALDKNSYFVDVSKRDYGENVLGVLHTISKAGGRYSTYYKTSSGTYAKLPL